MSEANARSRSVGLLRFTTPRGDLSAEVLGDRIKAMEDWAGVGGGKPCMSRTSILEPSFSLIGEFHIMIPEVVEVF